MIGLMRFNLQANVDSPRFQKIQIIYILMLTSSSKMILLVLTLPSGLPMFSTPDRVPRGSLHSAGLGHQASVSYTKCTSIIIIIFRYSNFTQC